MTASPLLNIDEKAVLTEKEIERRRQRMNEDVWLFIRFATPKGYGFVARFHQIEAYLLAGDAVRLAACLNRAETDVRYRSEYSIQLAAKLRARGINWNTRDGIRKLRRYLDRVNNRAARSTGKTALGTRVVLHASSVDPDLSIGMASKSDPAAQDKLCVTIGEMMLTDDYRMYYGHRLYPKNPESHITKKFINMYGRAPSDQKSIEARGINSQWTGNHYDWIYADDIVGTESGEASTDDALRWIASLSDISKRPGLGDSRHVFNGTIYGQHDDNSVLIANEYFLSTCIPIWKKNVPHTLANIMVDGKPTLPEWSTVEDIRRDRNEKLSNPKFGAVSWLQNQELCAADIGAMQFDVDLLRRSKFKWITKRRTRGTDIVEYRVMRRYLWTPEKAPKLDERIHASEPCGCWMNCGKPNHAYVEYDPLTLFRVMAVDQAWSQARGDRWALGAGAQDPEGYVYLLKGISGFKYHHMLTKIPVLFTQLGGAANPPLKVGIEANAVQGMTVDWMKLSSEYQFLARKIEKLSHGNIAKPIRIFNHLYSGLESGHVLIDPEYTELDAEALSYNPEADDPEDNRLDVSGMVISLCGRPRAAIDLASDEVDARNAEREYSAAVDEMTGVDITTDFMESMWN